MKQPRKDDSLLLVATAVALFVLSGLFTQLSEGSSFEQALVSLLPFGGVFSIYGLMLFLLIKLIRGKGNRSREKQLWMILLAAAAPFVLLVFAAIFIK